MWWEQLKYTHVAIFKYKTELSTIITMLSNSFSEFVHLIAGYVPFHWHLPISPGPHFSIPYIESYQYKARKLRISYTVGLLLSALETRLDCFSKDEFQYQRLCLAMFKWWWLSKPSGFIPSRYLLWTEHCIRYLMVCGFVLYCSFFWSHTYWEASGY